ncbi:Hypothetical protein IALB_0161 [Ignavibacterium album JCM 16511]|uniref:DarT domain-containing protein n=1 Tax=Ignavibacterium album (strain DSM 19864 / JCM 16511 / NBRC 101810 / Mat9-16) TaxID=945713 RepID=I0AFW6_IGNAJ|nr:DUF4433 domain-containing protein [Ignavibacterium album]AFH47873.1 Hypothetical protein IALB_0161 [Ignavibacterium album JCM 16511]
MKKQRPTYIYRIIHKENLQILIDEGKLVSPNLATNKNYIPIGEQKLINLRGNKQIKIHPFGTLRDYISFYFGVISPMLYCIAHGYDVPKVDQENIIYLVSSIEKLIESKIKFVFTDGHSYAAFTRFFNDKKDLREIDWDTVYSKRWNNTQDDSDRKRRKEAECLVYQELSLDNILAIVVYNQNASEYISSVIKKNNLKIPVYIKPEWYYQNVQN